MVTLRGLVLSYEFGLIDLEKKTFLFISKILGERFRHNNYYRIKRTEDWLIESRWGYEGSSPLEKLVYVAGHLDI